MSKLKGFGAFIREHRLKSGFKSQAKLSEVTGITPATISRIEKEVQTPSAETIDVLAQYLTTTTRGELMYVCGHWSSENEEENKRTSAEAVQKFKKDFNQMTDEELLEHFSYVSNGKELNEKQARYFLRNLRNLVENLNDLD